MDTANTTVIISLTDFVKKQLPEWYGNGVTLDLSGISLLFYPYSFFLHMPVLGRSEEKILLAKIKRQPDMGTLAEAIASKRLIKPGQDEYAMTQKIWDVFETENSPGCIAVKPIAYLENWNAVLMEKVAGKALKGFLLHPRIFFRIRDAEENLKKLLEASARWLRVFHDRVSDMQEVSFPLDDIWRDIDESLLRLERYSEGKVDIGIYRMAFEKALKKIEKQNVPIGIVHDDFHYSNILVTPEHQVCAIDNAGDYQACAYVDLATLITDPQTRSLQILTGGAFISSTFIDACKKIILQAYFGQHAYSQKVIDFFCALAILNKWSEGLARFSVQRQRRMPAFFLKRIEGYFSKLLFEYL